MSKDILDLSSDSFDALASIYSIEAPEAPIHGKTYFLKPFECIFATFCLFFSFFR